MRDLIANVAALGAQVQAFREELRHLATREWVREWVGEEVVPLKENLARSGVALNKVEKLFEAHEAKLQATAVVEQEKLKAQTWSAKLLRYAPLTTFLLTMFGVLIWLVKVFIERAVHDILQQLAK